MRASLFAIAIFTVALRASSPGLPPLHIELSADSPVLIQSVELAPGDATIYFRNVGTKLLSGLTLQLAPAPATRTAAFGITLPALSAAPNSVFPVHFAFAFDAPAQLELDCALFADHSSYGPDRLRTLHSLLISAAQRSRDRSYFVNLVRTGKLATIREDLNFGLAEEQSDLTISLRQDVGSPSVGRPLVVEPVAFVSAPVKLEHANVLAAPGELRDLQVSVRNTAEKAVSGIDLGLLIKDERGVEIPVALVPCPMTLSADGSVTATQTFAAQFNGAHGALKLIRSAAVYIAAVQFSDGSLWIPGRDEIDRWASRPALRRALADSPQQQILASVFRKSGMEGVEKQLATME